MRAPAFLPQGYKDRIRWTKKGVAKTGQLSQKGWTAQGEHWDGRESAKAAPVPFKLKLDEFLMERGWDFDVIDGLCVPKDMPPETRQLLLPQRGRNAP